MKKGEVKTLKDIARIAGVSHMTVSRVINNSGPVKPATRERILRIIDEKNFKPNATAKALIQGKTCCIGLALDDSFFPGDFTLPFIQGMTPVLNDAGYSYVLANINADGKSQKSMLHLLDKVDGLLIFNINSVGKESEDARNLEIPQIYISSKPENLEYNYVIADDFRGAYDAVSYLIHKGHKKIGYINGTMDYTTSIERRCGFVRAVLDHGLSLLPHFESCGDFQVEKGYYAMKELIRNNPEMTAVFAASDLMAFGAYKAVKEAGMTIPDDMAMVGYDNREFSAFLEPSLTTVEKPKYEMGELAARMMLRAISHIEDQPRGAVVQPKLIVRDST